MRKRENESSVLQLLLKLMKVKKSTNKTEFTSGKMDHVCTRKCETSKCSKTLRSDPIHIKRTSKSNPSNLVDDSLSDTDTEDVQCISSSVLSDPMPSSFRQCSSDAPSSSVKAVGEGSLLKIGSPHLGASMYHDAHKIKTPNLSLSCERKLLLSDIYEHLPERHSEESNIDKHLSRVFNHASGLDTDLSGDASSWKLPWSQPKVVMCPYCDRPRLPKAHEDHKPDSPHPRSIAHSMESQIAKKRTLDSEKLSGFHYSECELASEQDDVSVDDEKDGDALPGMYCHCPVRAAIDAFLKLRIPKPTNRTSEY